MKLHYVRALLGVLLAGFLFAQPSPAVDADTILKMEGAAPAEARVKAAKPRKLLVFTLCKGFAHSSIPFGTKALELMGRKTGAYEAVVSDDPAMFAADRLAQFDAVCLNNTTGELFDDPALKQRLLDFVKNGKGLIGIHAATDCFYQWPEFGEMIGGYFDGHPWGGGDTVTIKLDDPAHPLCAAFQGRGFTIKDEIYQFREPYSRAMLRVLLSIDTAKSDMTKKGIKRGDGDFAVAWVRNYGQGRVFYCSLGHNPEVFWNPAVLRHYLDGIQFAMGDLPGDATPSAQLSPQYVKESAAKVQEQVMNDLAAAISRYEVGQNQEPLVIATEQVIAAFDVPEERARLAKALTKVLESDATLAGKEFICKQLYLIGGQAVLPALAKMLRDEKTADMARYALQNMPGEDANTVLLTALRATSGKVRIGVINSLGERRDAKSARALGKLTSHQDMDTAAAAIRALSKVGGPKAAKTFGRLHKNGKPELQALAADAYLQCADGYRVSGNTAKAEAIYEALYSPGTPSPATPSALEGLVATQGDKAIPLVGEALKSEDGKLRNAAAAAARIVPGSAAATALAALLPSLPPAGQALLIVALADRGDAAALEAVTGAAKSSDDSVRAAAITALGTLGNASSVLLLAQAAAEGQGAESDAARTSLNRLRGADINVAIVRNVPDAPTPVRVELIRSLAARHATEAVPALLKTAEDADESVRAESFAALAALADASQTPELVRLLVAVQGDKARAEAENAATAAAARVTPESARALGTTVHNAHQSALLAALPQTRGNAAVQSSLLRVLGRIGDNSALTALRGAARNAHTEVKDAAIRALANWPNDAVLDDLQRIAERSPNESHRVVALRGYLRILAMPSDRAASDTLKRYETALRLSPSVNEKKAVLAGLGNARHPRAVTILASYAKNKALSAEARAALDKLSKITLEVSASLNSESAKHAVDGKPETRWGTGTPQQNGQWFQIDLGWEKPVRKIVLDAGTSTGDYPRGYEVFVAKTKADLGAPVAAGKGTSPVTEIPFKPRTGRYVRIVQTGSDEGSWWSIHQLNVE